MTQFMMQGFKVLLVDLDALFYTGIIAVADIPSARMTNNIAVTGLFDHRVAIETVRQFGQSQRGKKSLGRLGHLQLIVTLIDQRSGYIQRAYPSIGFDQIIDVFPALRPHIAQQMRRNRPLGRHLFSAVGIAQFIAHITV